MQKFFVWHSLRLLALAIVMSFTATNSHAACQISSGQSIRGTINPRTITAFFGDECPVHDFYAKQGEYISFIYRDAKQLQCGTITDGLKNPGAWFLYKPNPPHLPCLEVFSYVVTYSRNDAGEGARATYEYHVRIEATGGPQPDANICIQQGGACDPDHDNCCKGLYCDDESKNPSCAVDDEKGD